MNKRKSEFEHMVEAKIINLESNIKRLGDQIIKQKAEIKAWKEAIEWDKAMNALKKKKVEVKK